ncbi:phage tail protein [Tsuneonella sp. HG222]
MSKVLKTAAIVVGAAALVLTGVGAVIGATALAGLTATLGGITAGALTAASMGLSLGAQLLAKKPKSLPAETTNRLFANLDPQAPRKIVFGRTAMATDIRYQAYTGANQNYLNWIVAAASHAADAVEEVWLDDRMAWSASGGINAGAYDPWFLQIYAKEEGVTGNGFAVDGTWTAASSLTGCAHLWLRFLLTEKNKTTPSPFAQSVPTRVTIVGRGMPVPDVRIPGVDPEDQATWVFGDSGRNPALQMLAYLVGWRIDGQLAVGRGVPIGRIDLDSFITAANLCDEPVTLAVGGTEPRYRCDGVFTEAEGPSEVLGALNASMNAVLRDAGGKLALTVLHNDLAVPVAAFTENDILGEELWKQTAALHETPNVVRGRYVEPGALYQLSDYPEVALDSVDGQDRFDAFDLPLVQSPGQAQRLAKQRLQRLQYPGTYSVTMNARAWQVSLGQVVTVSHAFLGWDAKPFRVAAMGIAIDGRVPMVLAEEHPDIYAWDADETPAVVPGQPTGYDPTLHPWYTSFGAPPNGQLLWDDTFDPAYWILPDEADRVVWADSRSNWAARIGFTADTDVRIVYSTSTDRMPRTFPGKRLYLRITAQPSWSGLVPVEIDVETVELEDGGSTVPVELFVEGEAAFPLTVAIDWLDTAGDFLSRSVIGTLDPADGEVTLNGSAQAPGWGLATVSIGYPDTGSGSGWWTVFEPWLAEYEPTADVTVNVPNVPETVILCDVAGVPKAGQVDPRYVAFRLLKGELDVTAAAEWARTLTYGALNSTIETLGDANPGRLNIYYFEASSILEIAATFEGRVYTVEHKVTMQKDGAPSSGGGGSGTAGSAYGAVNGIVYGTTKFAIGDELEVTVGSGGTVSLSASYEFSSDQYTGTQTCSVQWYKWNGSAYVAFGSPAGPSSNYVAIGGVPGQGSKTDGDTGLTPGAVEKYRLYGAAGGFYTVYFAGDLAAVSS